MAFIDRSTFERFRPVLEASDVSSSDLTVASQGNITVGYAPIHYVNEHARVLIVGITPGQAQASIAVRECSAALQEGASPIRACIRAKYAASFAGAMRTNLTGMLDDIGVARTLGVASTADLFTTHQHWLDTGSVLPYPIFVNGRNYTGHAPRLSADLWIWEYTKLFQHHLAMLDDLLIVPLGETVSRVIRFIAPETTHCLFGFPHPSGANGHRRSQFAERRSELKRIVSAWSRHVRQRITER